MHRGVVAAIGLLVVSSLAGCGFGGDDTTSSTLAPLSSSTVFRTIPTTSTTLPTTVVPGGQTPGTERIYTVAPGDYPLKIVREYGCTSWEEIANYNEVSSDVVLIPGATYKIPATCGESPSTTAASGGSETTAATTGTTAATSTGGSGTYTVAPGDTVYGIAAKFDVSPGDLASANGWSDGVNHAIFPGDVINLP